MHAAFLFVLCERRMQLMSDILFSIVFLASDSHQSESLPYYLLISIERSFVKMIKKAFKLKSWAG